MRQLTLMIVAALLAGCGASSPPVAEPTVVPTAAPSAVSPSAAVTSFAPSAVPAPSAAVASSAPTDDASPSEPPESLPAGSVASSPPVVEIGTGTTITTGTGGRATVGVVDFRRDTSCGGTTPSAGNLFVSATVGYSADSGPLAYGPTDWIVTDSLHRMAAANPRIQCQKGTFEKGTLAEGQNAGGWLTFEIAADATQVDLVYFPAGGPKALWHLW